MILGSKGSAVDVVVVLYSFKMTPALLMFELSCLTCSVIEGSTETTVQLATESKKVLLYSSL